MFGAPRENGLLVGHTAAESALREAATAGRLHHAWLIGGPSGVGKATLAFRFARWLLAGGAGETLATDPHHPSARRVAAGTHADLLSVQIEPDPTRKRMRTEITVEDVRDIPPFLRLTPAEGGWRVVVVDEAEKMNRFGANALLKILEEPPARAVLLLVSHAPGMLLPTLRSRCRTLTLSALADPHMREVLGHAAPDITGEALDRLLLLAEGSPGRAIALSQSDGVAFAALADSVLQAIPALTPQRMAAVADQVARNDAGFRTFLEMLRAGLAGAVREEGRAPGRLSAIRPLSAWSEAWSALGRVREETEFAYLDKRQAVMQALTLLSAA